LDDVIDDLIRNARRCQQASIRFDAEPVNSLIEKLRKAAVEIGDAWCGSWLG
jgi:hypothetical protein